jgi:hypothetical protein
VYGSRMTTRGTDMNKILFACALVLAASGCAVQPATPVKAPEVVNTETPVCESKTQCDRMWVDAQSSISTATGMKIRLLTDTRIETFSPHTFGYMSGVVTKYPISENKYEIRLQLDCYRNSKCADLKAISTNGFNLSLVGYRPGK